MQPTSRYQSCSVGMNLKASGGVFGIIVLLKDQLFPKTHMTQQ